MEWLSMLRSMFVVPPLSDDELEMLIDVLPVLLWTTLWRVPLSGTATSCPFTVSVVSILAALPMLGSVSVFVLASGANDGASLSPAPATACPCCDGTVADDCSAYALPPTATSTNNTNQRRFCQFLALATICCPSEASRIRFTFFVNSPIKQFHVLPLDCTAVKFYVSKKAYKHERVAPCPRWLHNRLTSIYFRVKNSYHVK